MKIVLFEEKEICRISSYSFRKNYSFLNLEIVANSNSCRNIVIFYLINVIFAAEIIQGRKIFKSGNHMRKYSTQNWSGHVFLSKYFKIRCWKSKLDIHAIISFEKILKFPLNTFNPKPNPY